MAMLVVLCVTSDGQQKWYRLSPKIARAMTLERKMRQLSFKEMTHLLLHHYITIPLTSYRQRKAVIGVGKVLSVRWADYDPKVICTRSQFVDYERLQTHLWSCYKYLRHDYSKYSRLNIFVNLWEFRKFNNEKILSKLP